MELKEVSPPGWGHTKAEKEKTKPDKPKSKIGGTAAAFKRALDDGRFKGLPGDKTYKDKKASMFKLMWSMKKKGDKPHYKPGTDKKYKKYQDEDWKPEIEHSKLGDAVKKKREKKRKEAESSLPPHLRLDAMKKAFAHTNEEATYDQRDKELKKTKKAMDHRHKNIHKGGDDDVNEGASIIRAGSRKKSSYRGPTGDHKRDEHGHIVADFYKKKPAPTGDKNKKTSYRDKPKKDLVARRARIKAKKAEKEAKKAGSVVQTKSGKKVNSNYEKLKAKIYARDDARRKKNQEYAKKHNPPKKKQEHKWKYTKPVNEGMTPMQDNNLFGNAYAGSKKDSSKKKPKAPKFNAAKELVQSSPYMKPALQQVKEASFKDYMAQAQAARDREKKRIEDRKKADAQYSDTRKHGVRFYDKKGKGRIKSGKKIYD